MLKKERNYEVKINGISQLKDMPRGLQDFLCVALLDNILLDKENVAVCMGNTKCSEQSEIVRRVKR